MIYGRFEKLRKLFYRRFRSTLGWSGKWGGVVLSIRIFSLMPQSERIPRSYQPGPLPRQLLRQKIISVARTQRAHKVTLIPLS